MDKLIVNKRWIFSVFMFLILIALGIQSLADAFWVSLAVIAVGSMLLLGYLFVFPNRYRIDANAITIYYGFGIHITATWRDIKLVEDHHSNYGIFPWSREYHIGYFQTKFPLWEMACIPKNKKTTILLEKYYQKPIRKSD